MANKIFVIRSFIITALVIAALGVLQTPVQAATYTITVNSGSSTGAIKYGGIGWLYGLDDNNYVPDSKLTTLVHPGYSGQRAPHGLQHPCCDALNDAPQAIRVGMKGIDIYVQDYYAAWPYPNNGVSSYIKNVVDPVVDYVKADPNRSFYRYDIFNEPDWIWYGTSGSKLTQFENDWKTVYNEVKSRDGSSAKIIGPSFEQYNSSAMDSFMGFAKANNVLPDVVTWHALNNNFFTDWYNDYNNYRSIESKYGISPKEIDINEYGRGSNQDIPIPGQLIQYLARFETSKVWGGMAFWNGGGNLDNLLTSQGAGNGEETGAYWMYAWYGQMTGNTVSVGLPDVNGSLQAIATKSGTNTVKVIFGGAAATVNVNVNGLSSGTVKYDIYETDYTTGHQAQPGIKSSGTATVSNGQVTVSVAGTNAQSAYLINMYPSSGGGGTITVDDETYGSGQNQFNYRGSGWLHGTCNNCYASTNSWDKTTNDYVTVAFTGTQIKLYVAKDPKHGIGAVSIDGGGETNVDLYASSQAGDQLLWTSPTLSRASHTFKLRVTGTKNSSSSDYFVVPDRVDILP